MLENIKYNTLGFIFFALMPFFIGINGNAIVMNYSPEYGVGKCLPLSFIISAPILFYLYFKKISIKKIILIIPTLFFLYLWCETRAFTIIISLFYLSGWFLFTKMLINRNIISINIQDFINGLSSVCLFYATSIFMSWLIYNNLGVIFIESLFIYNIQQYYILILSQSIFFIFLSNHRLIYKIFYYLVVLYISYALSSRLALLTIFLYSMMYLPYRFYSKWKFDFPKSINIILPFIFLCTYILYLKNYNIGSAEISRLFFFDRLFDNLSIMTVMFPITNNAVKPIYSMHSFYFEIYKYFGVFAILILLYFFMNFNLRKYYFICYFVAVYCLATLVVEQPLNIQTIPFLSIVAVYSLKHD